MQRLNQVQGGATSQLVDSLTSKACGVFLWVCFVEFVVPLCLDANFNIVIVYPSVASWDDVSIVRILTSNEHADFSTLTR